MKTIYIGSGGLGDSVILGAKLMNIVDGAHQPGDMVHYTHLESNKRSNYEHALIEYWRLVANYFRSRAIIFTFNVEFYPHGKFWQHVPQKVFNTSTGLTTKVDRLCSKVPGQLVIPDSGFEQCVAVIIDGGGGSRGISPKACIDFAEDNNLLVVAIGQKEREINSSKVYNLTGRTCLTEALSIVSGCKAVIGPDGIITYFAAMYQVPTCIFYHAPNLPVQYSLHQLPDRQVVACVTQSIINEERLLNEVLERLA